MQQTLDRKSLSPLDNARLTLNNAALYLIRDHKIKPWLNQYAPFSPDVEAFKMLCAAICHTYTRCLVCSTNQEAVDWTPLAHCEFCNAPLCDRCYEDHWRECAPANY